MKSIIILLTITIFFIPEKNWVKGRWIIDFIILDSDTIYKQDHFYYTLEYNRTLNPNLDSIELENLALHSFKKTSKLYWEFDDSTFLTAAMRSGGRGNLNDTDFGTYFRSNDSIYMTNTTRNNYKSIFLIEERHKYLHFKENGETKFYMQLKKVK